MLAECSPTEVDTMSFEMAPSKNSTQSADGRESVTVEEPVTIPTVIIHPLTSNKWKTRLCACNLDEETLWWGFWCCYLVQARTAHSFEIDKSDRQLNYFWGYIATVLVSSLILGLGLSILFAIVGAFLLAWNRAALRKKIREKLSISGNFCDDFLTTTCCSCCAVCQEVCCVYIDFVFFL